MVAALVAAVAAARARGGGAPEPRGVAAAARATSLPAAPLAGASSGAPVEPPACAPFAGSASPASRPRPVLQRLPAGNVSGLAISTRGELALVADDGTVSLWDTATRSLTTVRKRPSTSIARWETVTWDDGGDRLLIVDPDGVTSMDRGGAFTDARRRLAFPAGYGVETTWQLQASPAGHLAAAAGPLGGDAKLLVWPPGKRGEPARVVPFAGGVGSLAFARSRPVLAVAATRRKVAEGTPESDAGEAPHGAPEARAAARERLFETTLHLLPADGGAPGRAVLTRGGVFDVRDLSADGSLAALATEDGRLLLADVATGAIRWTGRLPFSDATPAAKAARHVFGETRFAPDGLALASFTHAGLALYDVRSGRLLATMGARIRPHDELSFAGEDTLVVTSRDDAASAKEHAATWWSLADAAVTRTEKRDSAFDLDPIGGAGDVVIARTAQTRACPFESALVTVERRAAAAPSKPPRSGAVLAAAPKWPLAAEESVSFCVEGLRATALDARRGRLVVEGPFDRKAKAHAQYLLDLTTGKRTALSRSEGFAPLPAVGYGFSADGRLLLMAPDKARGVGVWDATTGSPIALDLTPALPKLGGKPARVGVVALSSDRARLAVQHDETRISWLELPGGKLVRTVTADAAIELLASHPDPATFVAALADGSIRVYRDGAVVGSARSDGGAIGALAVSPSGRLAATLGEDQAVRVWSLGDSPSVRASLVDFPDQEYVAFTPGGAYAGTSEVADRLSWVFDGPTEAHRFEQFSSVFSRPELVRRRLAGADEDVERAPGRPPRLAWSAPPEVVADGRTARVRVRAVSASRVDVVRAYVEGRAVAAAAVCAPSGEASLELPLLPGENRVVLVAFDPDGLASNPASVDLAGPSAARAPDLFIVAVGVSRYPKLAPSMQLDAADDDARSIAAAFGAQAGPGKPFAAARTTLFVDDQATAASVTKALDELGAMKPDDVAIVFFAGHGQKPSEAEDMVLLTGESAAKAESLRATGIGWSIIGKRLARARGRVLVLLDACHSGHVTQDLTVPNDALASALVRAERAGAVVFAAAKGRQLSFEANTSRGLVLEPGAAAALGAPGGAHGFFTAAVLESLERKSTDRSGDGAIQLSELIDEVRGRVERASGGLQVPWVVRREIFGDFRIARPTR